MHRIDDPNATPENLFTEGDPISGTPPATKITDDWLNDLQEEICNVIEEAGITLVKGTRDQLVDAIVALIVSGAKTGTLTGYTSGAGTVSATDTILQAIQKLNGNAEANYRRVLGRSTGAVTVGNTNTETDLISINIPANTLGTNRRIRVTGVGKWANDGSNTLKIRIKLGGTTLLLTTINPATTSSSNSLLKFEFDIRANNSASAQITNGIIFNEEDGTSIKNVEGGQFGTTVDTTSDQTLKVTAEWTAADTSDTLTVATDVELI